MTMLSPLLLSSSSLRELEQEGTNAEAGAVDAGRKTTMELAMEGCSVWTSATHDVVVAIFAVVIVFERACVGGDKGRAWCG